MPTNSHRVIEVWRFAEVGKTPYNEPILAWTRIKVLAAMVKPLRAAERFESSQVFATSEMVFRVRWFADLQPTDLIVFDGKQYDITGIAELGRRRRYEITATWRQNGEEDLE